MRKTPLQRAAGVAVVLALLALLTLAAGRLGGLEGQPPADLGVQDGRLKAPSTSPNSVSSQAGLWPEHPRRAEAYIAPLPAADGAATLQRIAAIARQTPGAEVVRQDADYLYVRYRTPVLQFVDDAEFWYDAAEGVVQVRSASRLGRSDWGANRQRIESLRERLAGG